MNKVETLLGELTAELDKASADAARDPRAAVARIRSVLESLAANLREAVSLEVGQFTPMDPVTSVLNLGALEEAAGAEFGRALRYRRSLSATALVVDGFQAIEEATGDDGGGTFLRTMILDCCRGIRACDIVGRTDPAVFMILLPETPLDGAVHVGQRLRGIMRETSIPVGGDAVSYTVSVGVATADREDVGAQPLLDRVLEALRLAGEADPDGIIIARQTSLEDEPPGAAQDPESDFHKALGSVSVEYLTPEEL